MISKWEIVEVTHYKNPRLSEYSELLTKLLLLKFKYSYLKHSNSDIKSQLGMKEIFIETVNRVEDILVVRFSIILGRNDMINDLGYFEFREVQ